MNERKTPIPEPTVTLDPCLCLDCRAELSERDMIFCAECTAKIRASGEAPE